VRHYARYHRPRLHAELEWFVTQPSFDALLDEAVHARDNRGKRLSHQRRLAKGVIPDAYVAITGIRANLRAASDFDEIYDAIDSACGGIPGSGDLYVYDTALRIGAHFHLYPTRVFLQTGALDGAKRISRKYKARSVPLADFPEAYHALAPFEMENLLCCEAKYLHP
jgi:hypothetical protein